ncbi:Protein neuralized [Eumeta japonica]|uniref:Protein neuralized n=1 Tax=Eumeta variegata TaxID=151549 RepID=A0A4C1WUY0_EUMVA|nr:Protein neuralized [Eumeta japonica]
MGVNGCMGARMRGACHCPACPGAPPQAYGPPPPTVVLPPVVLEQETTPVKDKKGSKMKVLKKIKKKIGLAPRTSCAGATPNNLPPLAFHRVHGENVRLSRDGATARRVESFCKGVTFSTRPVRVNEKVCLRFVEISNNWSGVLRFGFTTHDPATMAHGLPKYACPDLTNKPGYWAKALGERFCEKDNLLHYYVNSAGDVHFGINGEEKGIFFTGVDTRNPIWALVDVYGNCTAVQFADPRAPNQIRRSLPSVVPDTEDRLLEGMRSLSVEDALPPPRFQSQSVAPLTLHRTKGRNVQFVTDRGVAARVETEFCQGYVFTARPMRPGQTLVVQILATEPAYAGSLSIGLTSCDPCTLRPCDLPDDAEQLLDRPEYWVVRRDAANGLRRGDELAVTLTLDGEVRVSRNGSNSTTVMHVDHTLRLWAFVDIYGATQKVRLLSTTVQNPSPPQQLRVQLANASPITSAGGTVLVVSLPPQSGAQNAANQQALTLASAHYIEPIQSSSSPLCLTGLQAPQPQPSSSVCIASLAQQTYPQPQASQQHCLQNSTWADSHTQCSSTSQNNSNQQTLTEMQPVNGHPEMRLPMQEHRLLNGVASTSHMGHNSHTGSGSLNIASSSQHQPMYTLIDSPLPPGGLTGTECTICYENPIDSVLYMCGHMCMCYRCAVQQWRGKGGGQCPLCRAHIKDVIRTYKS